MKRLLLHWRSVVLKIKSECFLFWFLRPSNLNTVTVPLFLPLPKGVPEGGGIQKEGQERPPNFRLTVRVILLQDHFSSYKIQSSSISHNPYKYWIYVGHLKLSNHFTQAIILSPSPPPHLPPAADESAAWWWLHDGSLVARLLLQHLQHLLFHFL
jgi:hypothetical protein